MHGISIAQKKLQTLILKLVLNLKGRYRGFFKLTSKEEHMSWLQNTSLWGKSCSSSIILKRKLTLKEMCNLVPEWYTVHCEIQAFIKLAGCECIALMLT